MQRYHRDGCYMNNHPDTGYVLLMGFSDFLLDFGTVPTDLYIAQRCHRNGCTRMLLRILIKGIC